MILVRLAMETSMNFQEWGHTEWETWMRRMTCTALLREWQVRAWNGRKLNAFSVWKNTEKPKKKYHFVLQEKCFTQLPQTNLPLRRQKLSVPSWVPSWPPQDSCTWHGRVVWMFATQVGWQTVASATPSTSPDRSVEEACWECALSICFPIRPVTPVQILTTMRSATLVQKKNLFYNSFVITYDCLPTYASLSCFIHYTRTASR